MSNMVQDIVNLAASQPKEAALTAAASIFAAARARRDSLPVRQAAIEAHVPGGLSVEDLMVLITQQRERARTVKRQCRTAAA
ncbi:hypothetical protein ACFYUV_04130 [Nonomuraea sp. NPDC003560]|uniref:hypothetical protein n=1 Tax=Nonomuraea sp. NPDC003560 TaxID=3364341 RepID=UPI0036A0D07C